MIRQTGGLAFGDISTRSNPAFDAFDKAFPIVTTPNCEPSAEINRTLLDVICLLILSLGGDGFVLAFPFLIRIEIKSSLNKKKRVKYSTRKFRYFSNFFQ